MNIHKDNENCCNAEGGVPTNQAEQDCVEWRQHNKSASKQVTKIVIGVKMEELICFFLHLRFRITADDLINQIWPRYHICHSESCEFGRMLTSMICQFESIFTQKNKDTLMENVMLGKPVKPTRCSNRSTILTLWLSNTITFIISVERMKRQ